jgi:lipopolysaccharide/colanic/teichoic acid biosynthesis glycosyltransferase
MSSVAGVPARRRSSFVGRRAVGFVQVVGVLVGVLGLSKLHASLVAPEPYDLSASVRLVWAIGLVGLYGLAAYVAGLPSGVRTRRGAVVAALFASLATTLVFSLVQLAIGIALLPRYVVFGSILLVVPWLVLCYAAAAQLTHEVSDTRVVVVGDLDETISLTADSEGDVERPMRLSTVIAVEAARATGRAYPLIDACTADEGTVLVLSRNAQADESIVAQAATLHRFGVKIRTLSRFYEEWLGKVAVTDLEQLSLLFDIREIHSSPYARAKRLIDIAFGTIGVLLVAVITPFIVIANLVGNRGPLLFRQERVGKNGCVFSMLKFRSMRPVSTTVGEWTATGDARITLFGGFLRRLHLDELPQMVNVLRGDLSVVGPRPEQPHYVEELSAKLPFYEYRHLIRPGLTGWAQVKYGYASSEHDAIEKLQYDFFYLRRQSLLLDLRIVARTFRTVVHGNGR